MVSGSVVEIGVISTFTWNMSFAIPFLCNCSAMSCCMVSLTKVQVARRTLSLICVFDKVPLKPKYSLSMAMSISSENRSIRCQHLLNDVPPLKDRCLAYGRQNIARSTAVTHQSFSIASRCRMFSSVETRLSTSVRSSFDKSINFIVAISFLPMSEQALYRD